MVGIAVLAVWTAATVSGAGQTISSPDDATSVGNGTSMRLNAAGNPVISYYDLTNLDLKLLVCNDPACLGNDDTPTTIDSTGDVGSTSSLALDISGFPVISYLDQTNFALKIVHCNDANCLGGDESFTIPDTGAGPHSSMRLDTLGNPVVSYRGTTSSDLKIMHCNDANCSGNDESIETPDSIGSVGFHTSLQLDTLGNPVVSYQDQTNRDLKLLRCNDPNCTGGDESITSPDTVGMTGSNTALVLDASGNPIVTSWNDTNDDLRFLHCNDPACSGNDEVLFSVDAVGSVGPGSSLVLDASGNPVISYSGGALGLKVLHCGDGDCMTGNVFTTIDLNQSTETQLQLDSLGRPIIAYVATSPVHRLRLVHCADVNCAGNYDTDGDTCPDIKESQLKLGTELAGGRRNSKNPYDYFNPTGDGENRVDDILMVVDAYYIDDSDGNPGLPPYAPGYNPTTDRTLLGPDPWDTGPANGLQRVDDILNIVKQYFHDCSV